MSADETCDHHSVIAAPEGAQESVFQLASFGGSVPLVKKVKYRVLRDIQMRGLGFHACLDFGLDKRPPLYWWHKTKSIKRLHRIIRTNEGDRKQRVFLYKRSHCGSDQPVLTQPRSVPSPSTNGEENWLSCRVECCLTGTWVWTSRPTPCPSLVVTGAAGRAEVDIRVC